MLLQRAGTGTIPPSGFIKPDWDTLAMTWRAAAKPETASVTLGPAVVTLGHDDYEADDGTPYKEGHEFGWDNEHPRRQVQIGKFRIDWRPITNGDFYLLYRGEGKDKVQLPASWVEIDGDMRVSNFSPQSYALLIGVLGTNAVRSNPNSNRLGLAHHHFL